MSPFGKSRPGRRPRCARPSVETLEAVCLLSASPGLAHAKAAGHQPPAQVGRMQALHEQQRIMQQVRATLRTAGIPLCFQAKMGRQMLLAEYQKALNGTTWQIRYRQPVRHRGPYLVEIPPAVPTTPGGNQNNQGDNQGNHPTTPTQVTLNSPTLAVRSVTSNNATLTLTAGQGGAPFGVQVRVATLAAYQAAGNQFPADVITITLSTPLAEGQSINVDYPSLLPGTQYVAQAVALSGSVTTPAPGTDYLQSNPSPTLGFATQGVVQLQPPAIGTTFVDTDSANVAVTVLGPAGAPFGLEVRMAPLDDYLAAGNQFPDDSTVATLDGPFGEGEAVYLEFPGLQQGTEYVVQAVARAGFSNTPAPGVDYMQSNPSPLLILKTLEVVQAEPPTLMLHQANLHTIVVDLTTGAQGAPGGWIMEVTRYEDFLANGWNNASELFDVHPMAPGASATIPVNQLDAGTAYVFRAEAQGGGLVTTSEFSNVLIASTAVAPGNNGNDC